MKHWHWNQTDREWEQVEHVKASCYSGQFSGGCNRAYCSIETERPDWQGPTVTMRVVAS